MATEVQQIIPTKHLSSNTATEDHDRQAKRSTSLVNVVPPSIADNNAIGHARIPTFSSGGHARDLLPLLDTKDESIVMCDDTDFDRMVDLCTASFAGTENCPGEGNFRWLYGPELRGSSPGQHDPRFLAGLRWYMTLMVRASLKYGSAIGSRDPSTGELMGVGLTFHPDSMVDGDCLPWYRVTDLILQMGSLPREVYRLDQYGLYPARRLEVSWDATEHLHKNAPKRHWYIMALACDPKHTGKGVGTGILKTVIQLSDLEPGAVTYLESHSEKKTYYEKFMDCVETVNLRNPDRNGEGDSELHAFVSRPNH